MTPIHTVLLAAAASLLAACSSSTDDASANTSGAAGASGAAGTSTAAGTGGSAGAGGTEAAGSSAAGASSTDQLPPKGKAALEAWLATEAYLAWHCEPAPHAAKQPSAHSGNRVCSNDLTAAWTGGGERPKGSASVKVLYDASLTKVVGHAVSLKEADASNAGGGWYWYERVGTSVYADGAGVSLCVGCHANAGTTSTSAHSGDYVYTAVTP